MDVPELLDRAAAMVPASAVNEAGTTVADVREYLDHNEWEVALDLLADLDEGWPAKTEWWELLINAAELMWLTDTAAWCQWRRWESIHGVVRAELRLLPTIEGGRETPVPAIGLLRPLWDIGQRTDDGRPDLRVARVWVEHLPALSPGTTGSVRLAPLVPAGWRGLRLNQRITMHDGTPIRGTATITEIAAPR